MNATLVQISTSKGGLPKSPVLTAFVSKSGLAGDVQRDLKYHGGPDRAVCLYSEELYAWLATQGVHIGPGQVGENFTTRGLDLQSVSPGDRFRVGNCVIELTDIRVPCKKLNVWHPRLLQIIQGHSGWLARVIEEGHVSPGDPITAVSSAHMEKAS